jgi:hypothetical protein
MRARPSCAYTRDELEDKLRAMPWIYEGKRGLPGSNQTMWDYYQNYWLPFGEVLTDMEREGIKVSERFSQISALFLYILSAVLS